MTNKEKYYQIINTGLKNKPETGYYEGHHIVPKSICPLLKNSQNNIVYLTAKNHFLAHYYLYYWFKDELKEKKWAKKMCYAFNMMKRIISKSDDVEKLSELYDEVRKDLSDAYKGKKLSEETKSKISDAKKGRTSPRKGVKLSEETKRKLSEAHKGYHHTEESKIKMSQSKKGKPLSEIHKRHMIESKNIFPILQYTLDFKFVAEYETVMEAERQTKIDNGNISKCCLGKRNSAGGYIWIPKDSILYFF